jgi:hypothetical protein
MLDIKMIVRFEVDACLATEVPQESLLEVASRSKYFIDQLDWNKLYLQLALSQMPGLRFGVHERGMFTELRECQVDNNGGTGEPAGLPARRREMAAQLVRLVRVHAPCAEGSSC